MDSIIIIPVSIGYLIIKSYLLTDGFANNINITKTADIACFTSISDLLEYLADLYEEDEEPEHIVEVTKKVEKKEKRCPVCKETKPLTTEFWYKNKTRLDGFKARCKKCCQRIDQEKREANKKPPEKVCNTCQEIKPLTDEFWYRDNHGKDGFRSRCKICVEKDKAERKQKAEEEKKKSEIECDIAKEVNEEYSIYSDQEIIGYCCEECGAGFEEKPERCDKCNSYSIEPLTRPKLKV